MKANYHPERFGRNDTFRAALEQVAREAGGWSKHEFELVSKASAMPAKTVVLRSLDGETLTPNEAQALVESVLMKLALDLARAGLSPAYIEQCIGALGGTFTLVAGGVDWSQ